MVQKYSRHSVFGFLSAHNSSVDDDMSADLFDTDALSQAFIMLALADDLLGFVSCLLLMPS